jgi:argininosuccinate lyase
MRAAIDPAMLATDLADHLVAKGLPFRQAHSLAGQAVQLAGRQGKSLDALSLDEFQSLDPSFDSTVYQVFDPQRSVARRNVIGGTAPEAVRTQLQNAKKYLKAFTPKPTKGDRS